MELVTRELQQYYRTDQFDLVVTLILYLGDASFQFCPAFNAFWGPIWFSSVLPPNAGKLTLLGLSYLMPCRSEFITYHGSNI
jgi:hypothetical protein